MLWAGTTTTNTSADGVSSLRTNSSRRDGDAEQHWPLLPVLALIAGCWAALVWPWLSGRVTIPWDAKAHFLPQAQFLAQSLWRGESPFWTPFAFAGHPQVADPQSLLFSPPFLVLALFDSAPGNWSADTTVFLSVLAGMLALAAWFHDRRWHWAGAVIAALAFGFGASMAWRIQHTGQVLSLAYLPIVMLLLDRALLRASWRYGLAAGVVAAFMVLGRDQVALLAVYFLVAHVLWFWFVGERSRRGGVEHVVRTIPPLLAGGITGVAIIALPILMTLLAAAESNRPAIDFVGAGRGSLHPALLVTALAPDVFGSSGPMADYWGPPSFTWVGTDLFIAQNMGQLYIGAVPILLLLVGFTSGALWRREVRFFTLGLIAALVYALGWYTPVFRVLHAYLPGVDFFRRPADATFLVGYLMAIPAGYVAHLLFADPPWRPGRRAVLATATIVSGGFAFAIGAALHFDKLAQAQLPLAIAAAIVVAGAVTLAVVTHVEPLRPITASLALTAFTVADLGYSNGPGGASALPTEYYEMLEPSTRNGTITALKSLVAAGGNDVRRDRVELVGLGFHTPNASLTHGLENTLGYNPVRLDVYSRAAGAGDTAGSPGDRKFTPLFPSYRSALANRLGLRYIATGVPIEEIDKGLKPGDLPLLARTADGFIYENAQAWPRVRFATAAVPGDFARMIATGEGLADDASTIVVERGADTAAGKREPGRVRIVSYANTEVVLEAESAAGGYAVLHDLWHPWWRATVDGEPADIIRADVLFRAVRIGPGRHEIRFTFHPVPGALAAVLVGADAGDTGR